MVQADYTVHLDRVFQGPLDLLLHLVREQEVDIHEIEIQRVIDGYLGYLDDLRAIDIEIAGDFVFMAATLMVIKSRSLLPKDEEVDLEDDLDPRDELIQRLIEYRNFKRASGDLQDKFEERSGLAPRGLPKKRAPEEGEEPPVLDFGELTQWDLLAAYSKLMRETLADRAMHIAPDERPLRHYVETLASRLNSQRIVSLRSIVEDAAGDGPEAQKHTLIGTFCALLELMKIGVATANQETPSSEIEIRIREDLEGDLDEILKNTGFDDELEDEDEMGLHGPEEVAETSVEGAPEEGPEEGPEDEPEPEVSSSPVATDEPV